MTPTYPDGTRWMVAQTGIVKYEMRNGVLMYDHHRDGWVKATTRPAYLPACGYVIVNETPKQPAD
jgi:hypothetical protein